MTTVDVAIVGAGFAGLSAAHALRAGGASIAVFEAQDRAGGRVKSVRHDDGFMYDCGGQFFCRGMANLMGQLKRYGLTYRVLRHDPGAVGIVLGERRNSNEDFLAHDCWAALFEAAPDAADSMADWIASLPLDAAAKAKIRSGAEELWCSRIEDLSFRSIRERMERVDGLDGNIMEYACVEGLGTLAARMAEELGPTLFLNSPVSAVGRQGGLFQVATPGGQVAARHVVFAANPVVLGRVRWTAPEDQWLADFPKRFAPGQMRKIVMRYATAFWQGSDFGWPGQTDNPAGLSVMNSSDDAGGFDVLTVFAGGSSAAAWHGRSDADVLAEAMDLIEPMLGTAVRKPVTVIQTDWTGHPWVGGGYCSWPRPWSTDDPYQRMLGAHGGLHFAGSEIASRNPGLVEGALQSGLDVARRILNEG